MNKCNNNKNTNCSNLCHTKKCFFIIHTILGTPYPQDGICNTQLNHDNLVLILYTQPHPITCFPSRRGSKFQISILCKALGFSTIVCC